MELREQEQPALPPERNRREILTSILSRIGTSFNWRIVVFIIIGSILIFNAITAVFFPHHNEASEESVNKVMQILYSMLQTVDAVPGPRFKGLNGTTH